MPRKEDLKFLSLTQIITILTISVNMELRVLLIFLNFLTITITIQKILQFVCFKC